MDSQSFVISIIIVIILVLLALEICDQVLRSVIFGVAAGILAMLLFRSYRSSAPCKSYYQMPSHTSVPLTFHSQTPIMTSVPLPVRRFESDYNHRGEGNVFDPDWRFYRGSNIKNLYGLTGVSGDTKLANRSVWQGTQAKRSQDIRARADKYNFAKWFTDGELEQQEKRVWWETDVGDIWSPYT